MMAPMTSHTRTRTQLKIQVLHEIPELRVTNDESTNNDLTK